MNIRKLNETLKSMLEDSYSDNDLYNPYSVQEFHSDISDAIEAFTKVQELLMENDENFDEPSLKAIRAAESILNCAKKFRADLLKIRAAKWESKNEAIGDTLRSHRTLNGNPYTETDEGKFTFEFLGLPIEYQMYKYTETNKETGEVVNETYKIEPSEEGRNVIEKQVSDKIKQEFKNQAKNLYSIDITRIDGNTMVGIPNAATYIK